jgi:hypothetical protein
VRHHAGTRWPELHVHSQAAPVDQADETLVVLAIGVTTTTPSSDRPAAAHIRRNR